MCMSAADNICSVLGQEQAILRFIILGCVVYFQRRYITIPARWQKAGTKALLRPEEVVQSFVTASLFPAGGHLTPFDDIEKAFREFAGDCVNHNTFTKQALGKELSRIIQEKAKNTVGWGDAYRKQGMHPVHKETRVIIWHNVGLRQQRQLVACTTSAVIQVIVGLCISVHLQLCADRRSKPSFMSMWA